MRCRLASVVFVPAFCAPLLAQSTRVTIPFLASATRPADLAFEGGTCEIGNSGATLRCDLQQVFLTTSDLAPDTCLITTNRYERVFTKETDTRWVSREALEGPCGVIEVSTLQDEGAVRWTMETRKTVTNKDAAASCPQLDNAVDTLSWRNIRRRLPCRFVQPGGIGR